tara:strand:- start:4297 stop:4491 length:195 start_codon:yes stop_codon:yes gene_type:complete
MVTKLDKYKQNLSIIDEIKVQSYQTIVAEIDHINREINQLGWWSVTTQKHINYVADQYNYKLNK